MLSGARVFITGASGFLGANLVRHALGCGARVTVLIRAGSDPWRLAAVRDRLQIVEGNLSELPSLSAGAKADGVDVVYHLAATGVQQTFADDSAMVEANVAGTYYALEFARRVGAQRFIHMGTSGEYGPAEGADEEQTPRPTGIYGATKASATILARAFSGRYGIPVVVLRPFAVYGPYEAAYRLLPYCILRGLRGAAIEVSSGEQARDYVHVDDVMHAAEAVASHPHAPGEIFNVCSGIHTIVRDVVTRIVALTGGRSPISFGARPHIPGEMWKTSGSPRKASAVLGWAAKTPLDDGLRTTIDWFKAHADHYQEYRP